MILETRNRIRVSRQLEVIMMTYSAHVIVTVLIVSVTKRFLIYCFTVFVTAHAMVTY